MKNIIFSFFVFSMLISCINENTGYRLVGKNGRVIYLEKKRPTFNQEKLKEKEQIAKQNNKVQQFNNKNNKIIRVNEDSKINDNLVLESSAYSLRSVIDTMVDNKDINTMARVVEKKQKPKTIKDFKIPESYFNSEKFVKETQAPITDNNKKNNKVINLNNINNSDKNNNKQKTQKKEPLFNTLFSHKKERNQNSKKQHNNNLKPIVADIDTKNKVINAKKLNINNKNIDNNIIKRNEDIKNEFLNSDRKSSIESNNNLKTLNSKNNSSLKNKTKDKIIIKDNNNLIKNKYYIQLGSYNDIKKANKTLNEFNSMGNELKIVPVSLGNQQMYRVVIGTFDAKSEAEKVMEQIIEKGHFDVFIFKK